MKCKKFVAMTLQRTLRAEIPPQAHVFLADIFSWPCVSVHHTAVQQPLVRCLRMPGPRYVCHGWKCAFLPHFHVKISSMSLKQNKYTNYFANAVSSNLGGGGDPGILCGNDDYLVFHSPRILSTASHNYPRKSPIAINLDFCFPNFFLLVNH
jgi:hypothetical protein